MTRSIVLWTLKSVIKLGMFMTKKELDEMKISDVASSDNRTYNNDMTQTYVFNNAGEMLYPLRAVTKLGMFMTKKELDDMKNSVPSSTGIQTYNNDMTQTYVFNNAGEMLYPLRAVTKLGMFMTKTESAKLFRDSIIEELQAGVTFKKAYQSTIQAYLQQMELFMKILLNHLNYWSVRLCEFQCIVNSVYIANKFMVITNILLIKYIVKYYGFN